MFPRTLKIRDSGWRNTCHDLQKLSARRVGQFSGGRKAGLVSGESSVVLLVLAVSEGHISPFLPHEKKAEDDILLWKKQEAAAKEEDLEPPRKGEQGPPKV